MPTEPRVRQGVFTRGLRSWLARLIDEEEMLLLSGLLCVVVGVRLAAAEHTEFCVALYRRAGATASRRRLIHGRKRQDQDFPDTFVGADATTDDRSPRLRKNALNLTI